MILRKVPTRTCLWSGTTTRPAGSELPRIMWASFLPAKLELTSLEHRPHILAAQIREYEDSPVNGMSASIAPA